MAFSGVRHTKKMLKEVDKAIEDLKKAKDLLEYCNDTTGNRCSGRPDEVDGSKEEAESEAINYICSATETLKNTVSDYMV